MAAAENLSELRRVYLDSHHWCALCWGKKWIQLAHIVSRGIAGSAGNVTENVLALCERCHMHGEHGLDIGLPQVTRCLLIKIKDELGELDAAALAKLWGRTTEAVLSCIVDTEVPGFYVVERERNARNVPRTAR